MIDWSWKLQEAIERIKTRHEHIGRKTGAPFLAIVYPPEAEAAVLKEWHMLLEMLDPEFEIKQIDVLAVTMSVVEELGGENIIGAMADPMPGSNPEVELGHMWVTAVAAAVQESMRQKTAAKTVVVLERLAALYPATGPRAVMQALWDSEQSVLDGPVVVLIPGRMEEARVYAFVNQQQELMYRGDIL
jgi:hypothetical protein